MAVSKQRDLDFRISALLSKSVQPQHEDTRLANTCALHTLSMLSTFRAAKKTFSTVAGWSDWDCASECFHLPEILIGAELKYPSIKKQRCSNTNIFPPEWPISSSKIFISYLKVLEFPQWTASNLQPSHCSGLRICVSWTMNTHAWFLVKKHAFMQVISMHLTSTIIIYLEICVSKFPSGQVKTLTNDPYSLRMKAHVENVFFNGSITNRGWKDRDMGSNAVFFLSFFFAAQIM